MNLRSPSLPQLEVASEQLIDVEPVCLTVVLEAHHIDSSKKRSKVLKDGDFTPFCIKLENSSLEKTMLKPFTRTSQFHLFESIGHLYTRLQRVLKTLMPPKEKLRPRR